MKRSFWIGMWVHLAAALAIFIGGIVATARGIAYGPFVILAAIVYICVGIYMFWFAYHFNKDKK